MLNKAATDQILLIKVGYIVIKKVKIDFTSSYQSPYSNDFNCSNKIFSNKILISLMYGI